MGSEETIYTPAQVNVAEAIDLIANALLALLDAGSSLRPGATGILGSFETLGEMGPRYIGLNGKYLLKQRPELARLMVELSKEAGRVEGVATQLRMAAELIERALMAVE